MNSKAKDNEQFQKLGIVDLVYMHDKYTPKMDYDFVRKGTKVFLCSPVRLASVYFLVDGTSPWDNVIDFMNFIVGKMIKLRTRAIRGTYIK